MARGDQITVLAYTKAQGPAGGADPDVPPGRDPRGGGGRRDKPVLAHHGLQLSKDRLG